MRALFEICLCRGWAALARKCLDACNMIEHRMWKSHSPLRQFRGAVNESTLRKLERKDISFDRYYDMKPSEIGELVRNAKLGRSLHRLVHCFPKLDIEAHVMPITRSIVKVDVVIIPDFEFLQSRHGFSQLFWIIVEDGDGEEIMHFETFSLRLQLAEDEHSTSFTVRISDPLPAQYFLRVVSDRFLHSECVVPLSFRNLVVPEKFPPHTRVLDLQPIPASAFGIFEFEQFNKLQTQAFASSHETDENVLLAAPPGSDTIVCAELAMLRLFNANPTATCVYVATKEATCRQQFSRWSEMFKDKALASLTGDTASDAKKLASANIVVSTAEHFEVLSRRWRQRKSVQSIDMLIADDLHMIYADEGSALEVLVSRMRLMSGTFPLRIFGISASVANAIDLASWIGAKSKHAYNFHPSARPFPLNVHVHGFDVRNVRERISAMRECLEKGSCEWFFGRAPHCLCLLETTCALCSFGHIRCASRDQCRYAR